MLKLTYLPDHFMGSGTQELGTRALPRACIRPAIHFVTGRENVLQLSDKLVEFSARCDQISAMDDIVYFLSKPGAMPRIPHLLLVSRNATMNLQNPDLDGLLGVLLIFEQKIYGFGARAFATNDRSGRSTLISEVKDRELVAALTSRALLNCGAHMILMSFRVADENEEKAATHTPLLEVAEERRPVARWAHRQRTIPGYLPLAETFDATLAKIGQKTRSNLRYYRRRAEADLGCVFLPKIEVSREELLEFNQECMYAVPAEVAGWRYDSLKELSEPIFMGVKDRDGRWLSMLGGRRYRDRSELLWQLNRDGLAANSLATVMRSYFIENEIAQGSSRLYIEGGTPHPIKFSFVEENLTDLVVMRRSLMAKVMQIVVQRWISRDNELSLMLSAKDLKWLPC